MDVSYLFVPAHKLNSARSLCLQNVDMIVIDLEDSVHPQTKKEARESILNFDFSSIGSPQLKFGIRINKLNTLCGINDIKMMEELYNKNNLCFRHVFIPKLKNQNELELYIELLRSIDPQVKFISIIETIDSINNIEAIANISDALILGQADLCSEMFQPNKAFIQYARARVCIAAAKKNIPAIDTNSFELQDLHKLEKECLEAYEEGFLGKAVIHPCQAETVQNIFSIRNDTMEKYSRWIDSYAHSSEGFFIDNGEIVAPPFVAKARKMLDLYNKYGADSCRKPNNEF